MKNIAFEVNFDGIVGPTHNYGGLSEGNFAAQQHKQQVSNPKEAALQGLEKMKFLMDLGIKQGVFPPQERPLIPFIRSLGYKGSHASLLNQLSTDSPDLLTQISSASSMWAANAATVSPSADNLDGKVHFTPANLTSNFHRSLETQTTSKLLRHIFSDSTHYVHHEPLPNQLLFSDEGAANHCRFAKNHQSLGIQLFVYDKNPLKASFGSSLKAPARQAYDASRAIARFHQTQHVIFAQQNPVAIEQGVFHHDVIGVSNGPVFLIHEEAFVEQKHVMDELKKSLTENCQTEMILLEIAKEEITLAEAVKTYLFNSQIVTLPNQSMHLICSVECQTNEKVRLIIDRLIHSSKNPINDVHFFDLRQSMNNGGGPACLRLRVVLTESEIAKIKSSFLLTEKLYYQLREWVNKHYRDRLLPNDLRDPLLYEESCFALDELTKLLKINSFYHFQEN